MSARCGIVIVENGANLSAFKNAFSKLEAANDIPVLDLGCVSSPPWRGAQFTAFLEEQIYKQIAIVGNLIEPFYVSVCLHCLEQGFQIFSVDTALTEVSPAWSLNLVRLTQSGATLLSVDQFIAELSLET